MNTLKAVLITILAYTGVFFIGYAIGYVFAFIVQILINIFGIVFTMLLVMTGVFYIMKRVERNRSVDYYARNAAAAARFTNS